MTTTKRVRTTNFPDNYPQFENVDDMILNDSLLVSMELTLEQIVREVMKK